MMAAASSASSSSAASAAAASASSPDTCANCQHREDAHVRLDDGRQVCSVGIVGSGYDVPERCRCSRWIRMGTPCSVDGCGRDAVHYRRGQDGRAYVMCADHFGEAVPHTRRYYELTGGKRFGPPPGTAAAAAARAGAAAAMAASAASAGSPPPSPPPPLPLPASADDITPEMEWEAREYCRTIATKYRKRRQEQYRAEQKELAAARLRGGGDSGGSGGSGSEAGRPNADVLDGKEAHPQ